jgi:hypothetical protein
MKLIKVMNFLGTGKRKKFDVEVDRWSGMVGNTAFTMFEVSAGLGGL